GCRRVRADWKRDGPHHDQEGAMGVSGNLIRDCALRGYRTFRVSRDPATAQASLAIEASKRLLWFFSCRVPSAFCGRVLVTEGATHAQTGAAPRMVGDHGHGDR